MSSTEIKLNRAAQDLWAAFDHAYAPDHRPPPVDDLARLIDAIADYSAAKMIDQLTHIAGAMIAKHAAPTDADNQTSFNPQP